MWLSVARDEEHQQIGLFGGLTHAQNDTGGRVKHEPTSAE